jgi:competence protein ComEA
MDTDLNDPTPAERLTAWLRATPAELVGLTVLLVGALAATGLLWWHAGGAGVATPWGGAGGDAGRSAAVGAADTHPADVTGYDANGYGAAGSDAAGSDAHGHGSSPPLGPGATGPEPGGMLTVHVTGAVAAAGVVRVPAAARVADAVAAAGGLLPDAAVERINLARPLTDGEHIHVPRPDEPALPAPDAGSTGAPGAVGADGRIDINRAGVTELQTLPGIGPARATAIVEHRDTHGAFRVPGDIRAVSGIGEATFQRLAPLITTG